MEAFNITAAGDFLMPMIIFKGKPGGMIEKKTALIQPYFHLRLPECCMDG
jgi:hypothetical protein